MSFVATWLDFNTSKPGPTGSIEGDRLLWLEVGLLRDPEGVIQAGGLGSAAVRLRCFQRAFAKSHRITATPSLLIHWHDLAEVKSS